MDIKIGFADSPRELVINLDSDQDAVVTQVYEALNGDAGTLHLVDSKDRAYIINVSRIAYVEVGTTTHRSVGFAGA
ncbi:DUF3107 domain-containing protein [Corynebacterium atrinae]|uniref:DUF3107 domain-containing protein n=1 Tax=Corynebacterium atrinae TaxID=1336740 RepID=UPI0025B4A3B3|nr:DUF3107 domain-containing protein [Corynebacterium atrinae]